MTTPNQTNQSFENTLQQVTQILADSVIALPQAAGGSTHLLKLELPACELLPNGVIYPYLSLPHLIEQRTVPPWQPEDAGVHRTNFFAKVPLQVEHPFKEAFKFGDNLQKFQTAMETTLTSPDITVLQMVSYMHPQAQFLLHRFRMLLEWEHTASRQDFELTDEQWQELLKREQGQLWIRLLRQLVTRSNARAMYEVRAQLMNVYGDDDMLVEQHRWCHLAEKKPARNVRQLLFDRLFKGNLEAKSTLQRKGDGTIFAIAPCGHPLTIRKIDLFSLPPSACATLPCSLCEKPMLQPEDYEEMMWHNESRRAEAYLKILVEWRKLDAFIDEDDDPQYLKIYLRCDTFAAALESALESMRQPQFLCPPELNFLGFHETTAMYHLLEDELSNGRAINVTAKEIYDELVDRVHKALKTHDEGTPYPQRVLPEGWWSDCYVWLTRTVKFALERCCYIEDPRHTGLHAHKDGLRLGAYGEDGEDTEVVSSEEALYTMQELGAMLEGTDLDEDEY